MGKVMSKERVVVLEAKVKKYLDDVLFWESRYRDCQVLIHCSDRWHQKVQETTVLYHEVASLCEREDSPYYARYNTLRESLLPYTKFELEIQLSDEYLAEQDGSDLDNIQTDLRLRALLLHDKELKQRFSVHFDRHVSHCAHQIWLESRRRFSEIPESEITNKNSEQCPHFLKTVQFFDGLSMNVQKDVLQHTGVNARTAAMRRWIHIAHKLIQHNDFSSVKAVVTALQYSNSLFRLHLTKAGLSEDDFSLLQELNDYITNQHEIISKEDFNVVPYLGVLRTQLSRITLIEDKDKKKTALQEYTNYYQSMQRSVMGCDGGQDKDEKLIKAIVDLGAPLMHQRETDRLFTISQELEPKDSMMMPGQLYSADHPHWLSQLRNESLIKLLVDYHVIPHTVPSQEQIDSINIASYRKLSHSEFNQRLKNIGITLPYEQVKGINRSNYQIYYGSLIDNEALRRALNERYIHRTDKTTSTKNIIAIINKRLEEGCSRLQLSKLLSKLSIRLPDEKTSDVLYEARFSGRDITLNYENDPVNQAKLFLREYDGLKSEINNYLILLNNTAYLNQSQVTTLLEDFRGLVSGNGMRLAGENVYMKLLLQLSHCAERLEASDVAGTPEVVALLNDMQLARQQYSAINSWVDQNGISDSQLRKDLKKLAPKHVFKNRQKWTMQGETWSERFHLMVQGRPLFLRELLSSKLEQIDGMLTTVKQASSRKSLLGVIESQVALYEDCLKPQNERLKELLTHGAVISESVDVSAIQAAIANAGSIQACERLRTELPGCEIWLQLKKDYKQLKGEYGVSARIMALRKKLQETIGCNFSKLMSDDIKQRGRGYPDVMRSLSSLFSVSPQDARIVAAGYNVEALRKLQQVLRLEEAINKRIIELPVANEQGGGPAPTDALSLSVRPGGKLHRAASIGIGFSLGAVAVALLPKAMVLGAGIMAAKFIAAKLGVGAAVGAGSSFGAHRVLSRFGLFSGRAGSIEAQQPKHSVEGDDNIEMEKLHQRQRGGAVEEYNHFNEECEEIPHREKHLQDLEEEREEEHMEENFREREEEKERTREECQDKLDEKVGERIHEHLTP